MLQGGEVEVNEFLVLKSCWKSPDTTAFLTRLYPPPLPHSTSLHPSSVPIIASLCTWLALKEILTSRTVWLGARRFFVSRACLKFGFILSYRIE